MGEDLDKLIAQEQVRLAFRRKMHQLEYGPVVRPHMRPHTWCMHIPKLRGDPVAFGIVFKVWPTRMTHLRFSFGSLGEDPTVLIAEFHGTPESGRWLMLPNRFCFNTLLKQFKGLSAGDL